MIYQMDFAHPLPLDRPEPMLEIIKMYLRGEGTNPHQRQQASEQKRIETSQQMLGRVKGIRGWIFRKTLGWGQSMAAVREDALAGIGLGYPVLRRMLRELGRRLVAQGRIASRDDIFWLEKTEIDACVASLDAGLPPAESLQPKVLERRAYWQRAKNETPPPMMPVKERVVGIKVDMFLAAEGGDQSGDQLKGTPTSAGKVTAPACVLHGPQDFDQMRLGDILVAGTTTPAWTPLFAMAAGVVTDIGGPLSHGSIVAREYGIPAVLGTGVATKRIRNGQMITVDGSNGVVTLLNHG